jgi:hypothetical protein
VQVRRSENRDALVAVHESAVGPKPTWQRPLANVRFRGTADARPIRRSHIDPLRGWSNQTGPTLSEAARGRKGAWPAISRRPLTDCAPPLPDAHRVQALRRSHADVRRVSRLRRCAIQFGPGVLPRRRGPSHQRPTSIRGDGETKAPAGRGRLGPLTIPRGRGGGGRNGQQAQATQLIP